MENWGLITFREALLLVDEKESSLINKLAVGTTVCHEIAHSWYDNVWSFLFVIFNQNLLTGLETWLQWNGGQIFGN
jgi:hypothetical protein